MKVTQRVAHVSSSGVCKARFPLPLFPPSPRSIPRVLSFVLAGVLVAPSCPTLCGPVDCNPPGSSVHGILEARILEWVAIPFSRGEIITVDQRTDDASDLLR